MTDPRTLRDVLTSHVERAPDAPLVIAPDNVYEAGNVLTYSDLWHSARRLSAEWRRRGLEPGATIGLFLPNGRNTTTLFLAALVGGYVIAPHNLLSQGAQLAYVIDHCECKILYTTPELAGRVREALAATPRSVDIVEIDVDARDAFAQGDEAELGAVDATSPGLLMYTSGTTGRPKGVVLTHANLLAGAGTLARWHGLTSKDRVLSSLPLYHINGQVISTITPFLSGGSIVAPHRFSASTWWDDVERYQCTWINMVPTIIAYLLNGADPSRTYHFPHVRFGRSASAPLPVDQQLAFERTFGIPIVEAMGMTESASVTFCNPSPTERRTGSPGIPCGVEAFVSDDRGQPVADGTVGEIRFRGPNVMAGYLKDPERTAEALVNGWLCTGDLGYRDSDGFYFITGRLKELIIKGGENIAPREIDEALLRHPAVLEAAAFAVVDPNYGQDIAAAVVLKPGKQCGASELRQHCLSEIGSYKSPRSVHFLTELPKGPSGKVQRLALPKIVSDAGEQRQAP